MVSDDSLRFVSNDLSLLVLPICIVGLLGSIKKSDYFMPTKLGLCFIDLDDWFKICFIPISAIIFVCEDKKRPPLILSRCFFV